MGGGQTVKQFFWNDLEMINHVVEIGCGLLMARRSLVPWGDEY